MEDHVTENPNVPADPAPTTTPATSPPSAAAVRMRALRRRRRLGMRCVQIRVGQTDIDGLIRKGYLSPAERENFQAIQDAADGFISDALADDFG